MVGGICTSCFSSMGARNRVGIGLSYRPARIHRLAGLGIVSGLLKSLKIPSQENTFSLSFSWQPLNIVQQAGVAS
jgi:hypothetical protein